MESAVLSPRDRLTIGTLFAKEKPEEATKYLSVYNSEKAKAIDTDQCNLNYYFLSFCKMHSLDAFEYLGALNKQDKVDTRRLFIGAMVRIYKPQILFAPVCLENGIGQGLCNILQMDNGNVSKTIAEAKAWYNSKTDPDFRNQVNDTVQALQDIKAGYGVSMFKMAG